MNLENCNIKMSSNVVATKEIHKTLKLCNFCTTKIGFSFIDKPPKSLISKIYSLVWFFGSTLILALKLVGEINYAVTKLVTSASVVEFVAGLHIIGYDTMSKYSKIRLFVTYNFY